MSPEQVLKLTVEEMARLSVYQQNVLALTADVVHCVKAW